MASENETPTYGFSCFQPKWMSKLMTIKWFLAIYSVLGAIQSMSFIYFTITLTTMEKRFKIPGKMLGIVLSGNEVSQVLLSLILSYYGGHKNRPRWIAWGTICSALSCFILAAPHFIYGSGKDALSLTYEYLDSELTLTDNSDKSESLTCDLNKNLTKSCDEFSLADDITVFPLILIFLSQFVLGIGTTLYYILGQTYIDDNSKKSNTPKLLAISMAMRMCGPVMGFLLGFICMSMYIEPSLTPIITKEDPRWMGAWWIGWIFLGTVMTLFAILIAIFPKNLPKTLTSEASKNKFVGEMQPLTENSKEQQSQIEMLEIEADAISITPVKPQLNFKDFLAVSKRITKNKIFMCNIFSGAFFILGASGYITYFAKYMEVQFQKSSAQGSAIAGPIVIFGSVGGLLTSGYAISKFKPRPKYLLLWNVIVGIGYMVGEMSYTVLDCPSFTLKSYSNQTTAFDFNSPCNLNCDCDKVPYSPVCFEPTMTTYFSPCHAGCHTRINNTKDYQDCSCLDEELSATVSIPTLNTRSVENSQMVKNGFCDADCRFGYYGYVAISGFIQMIGSSGRIGNMIVNYRAVDVQDKTFAQGMALWILSIFALIPGPVIYGYIFDNSCLIWDMSCGKRGNCWFYDRNKLRWTLNLTALGFTTIGVLLDVAVWRFGLNLKLYDDEKSDNEEKLDEQLNSTES